MIGLKVNVSFWIFQISPKSCSHVGEENSKFTYFWFSVPCGKLCNTFSELEMIFLDQNHDTSKQIQLFIWDLWSPFHSTLIWDSRPCKSYCLEQISRLWWSLLQIFLTPNWQCRGNQPFQINVRSFGNLITDFQGYLSKGILTNQPLLDLQKLDGTFFQCHQL